MISVREERKIRSHRKLKRRIRQGENLYPLVLLSVRVNQVDLHHGWVTDSNMKLILMPSVEHAFIHCKYFCSPRPRLVAFIREETVCPFSLFRRSKHMHVITWPSFMQFLWNIRMSASTDQKQCLWT